MAGWAPGREKQGPAVLTPSVRLSVPQEKRRRQAEMENQRRQLEDARRQLQHLKVPDPGGGAVTPILTLSPTPTSTLTLVMT